jgi:hypothetical protein
MSQQSEQAVYIIGLELYFRVRLGRAYASLERVLSTVPNFMEHYDTEEGFASEEDSKEFFRFIKALYAEKKSKFRAYANKQGIPHATLLATVLKEPEVSP